jgi:hypothetical protein
VEDCACVLPVGGNDPDDDTAADVVGDDAGLGTAKTDDYHTVGTDVAAAVEVGIGDLLVEAPDAAGAGVVVHEGADSAAMVAYYEWEGVETVHRWVHFGIGF